MAITRPGDYPRHWKAAGAALIMLAAGAIHFIILPHHWEHAPAHGMAMAAIGVLEVIFALVFWWRPTPALARAGVILAASLIALWAITRIAPAPFTNEAEEVDFAGVLTKILEAAGAAALLAFIASAPPEAGPGWTVRRTALTVLILSILLAAGIYEAARAAQPLFPQLSPPAMEQMDDH